MNRLNASSGARHAPMLGRQGSALVSQGQSPAPQPLPPEEGERLQSELAPHRSPPSDPQAGGPGVQGRRVLMNGVLSAIAQGGCFGSSFAIVNRLRVVPVPSVKAAAGLIPVVAGYLTAEVESALRKLADLPATPPAQHSLAFDALAPAALFGTSMGYARSGLPKFPATSARGAAASLLLSCAGTFVAGALGEAAAQASYDTSAPAGQHWSAEETRRVGVGRALSLLPYATLMATLAAREGRTLPKASLVPIGTACAGWVFRRALMPAAPVPPCAHGDHDD